MDFALMFEVLEGGVSEPIKWNVDNLSPDKNIIILDEESSSLYLWHGSRQGLVARRTALRQAESLKGHGYVVGKSIIGRDIKLLKEIDQRKIGRDPETTQLNEELQNILNREFKELDNFIITFDIEGAKKVPIKAVSKPEPKPTPVKPKPTPVPEVKVEPTPVVKQEAPVAAPHAIKHASEYNAKPEVPIKTETAPKVDIVPEKILDLDMQAKIGFVLIAITEFFNDIWVSKKDDGNYSVEHMDGKVCEFSISEGKIKFTSDSFSGISTNIKTEIQKKFVELSKLL